MPNIFKDEYELAKLGYRDQELSSRVLLNIDFARANMKSRYQAFFLYINVKTA